MDIARAYTDYTEATVTDAIGITLVTIATIDVKKSVQLGVEIANGNVNFDMFEIQGRFHPSGVYFTLFSAAAEYLSPAGILVGTSGDLMNLPASQSGWFILDVGTLESIRLQAACAAINGEATVYAGVQ